MKRRVFLYMLLWLCVLAFIAAHCSPYFGGDETAPHDMHIFIKDLQASIVARAAFHTGLAFTLPAFFNNGAVDKLPQPAGKALPEQIARLVLVAYERHQGHPIAVGFKCQVELLAPCFNE